MSTPIFRSPRRGPPAAEKKEIIATVDGNSSIVSVACQAAGTILAQIAPVLPTPTQVLRTLSQGRVTRTHHLAMGHQGQEDWMVAADFDATYECTVQNTGDDPVIPQTAPATSFDPQYSVQASPDLCRELGDAQREDPRIYRHRRRLAVANMEEQYGDRPGSRPGWEELRAPGDMHEIHDDPEVYALDSEPDDVDLDTQWSVLGDTRGRDNQER